MADHMLIASLIPQKTYRHMHDRLPQPPSTETALLSEALHRVLAENIKAPYALPQYDDSAMDGYAVCAEDINTKSTYDLMPAVTMGTKPKPLVRSQVAAIFTGGLLPQGADAVIPLERSQLDASSNKVRFEICPKLGQFIRRAGCDIKKATVVLKIGTILRAQDLALLQALGFVNITVYRRLCIGILSTGAELCHPQLPDQQQQALPIGAKYDSNLTMLCALVDGLGMSYQTATVYADDYQATRQALLKLAQDCDCVISSGGVSVGPHDYIRHIANEVDTADIDVFFNSLAIKPGRPTLFAEFFGKWLFALAGNPASAWIGFCLLVRPYLLAMQGIVAERNTAGPLFAIADFVSAAEPRRRFLGGSLYNKQSSTAESACYIRVNDRQHSGMLGTLSAADGIVDIPAERAVDLGDHLMVWPMPSLLSCV